MPLVYEMDGCHAKEVWDDLPVDVARHLGMTGQGRFLVAQHAADVEVPEPRFSSLKELGRHLFEIEKGSGGTYAIRNVPLYKAHPDTRKYGVTCDQAFIDRMVRNFYATGTATEELFGDRSYAWLPKVHYGHTPSDPDMPEKESCGLIDNLFRVEDFLLGDFVGLDKATLDKLSSGRFPDRSAEVDLKRARLLSCAVLGFRTPHFALPQMQPEKLRQHYQDVIAKNCIEGFASETLLAEDLPMPKATRKTNRSRESLPTDTQIAQFFRELQTNDELNERFEAEKAKAIQKHFGLMGGMPMGGDLMGLILPIMMQMMTQKMNSTPAGQAGQPAEGGQSKPPTDSGDKPMGKNATDVIDLESDAHHAADEEPLNEEGTSKIEGDGDEVDDYGAPAGETDEDTVSEKGEVVKHVADFQARAKNTLAGVKDKNLRQQIGSLIQDVCNVLTVQSEFIDRQHNAMMKSQAVAAQERAQRREATFKGRLERMFNQRNPNVSNEAKLAKHLALLKELTDAQATQYFANLEDVPEIPASGRKVARNALMPSTEDRTANDSRTRAKHELSESRALRQAGVKEEHLMALDAIEGLETESD